MLGAKTVAEDLREAKLLLTDLHKAADRGGHLNELAVVAKSELDALESLFEEAPPQFRQRVKKLIVLYDALLFGRLLH